MQIIQTLRDKGAYIIITLIVLALIGFLLIDYKTGGNADLFSNTANGVIGKVNGNKLLTKDYYEKSQIAEDMQAQQTGTQPAGTQVYQIRDQVWNQMVNEEIFKEEAEKLGLVLTPKEISYILTSNDPSNPLLQRQDMRDSVTGKLDINKAQQALAYIKKSKGGQRDTLYQELIKPLELSTAVAKYTSLINAAVYVPKWMQKQDLNNFTNYAVVKYVSVPYSTISDSSIKITDGEINKYISEHKSLFQEEKGRKLSYVAFSQNPSKNDSTDIYNSVEALKSGFETDSSNAAFLAQNGSSIPYSSDYVPKKQVVQSPVLDSAIKQPRHSVLGPVVFENAYALIKVTGEKELADSVDAKTIFISLYGPNNTQIRTDDVAKKLADSILNAVDHGASFTEMVNKYSDDPTSKAKGGDMGTMARSSKFQPTELYDYIFSHKTGEKGVVKTQYGYFVVDIRALKSLEPYYQFAIMAKDINASQKTINSASTAAANAAANKNVDDLRAYAKKNNLTLVDVPNVIHEMDYSVGALQDARDFVKWSFQHKKGKVSEPMSIDNNYVVGAIDEVYKKGTETATTARDKVQPILIKQKKAQQITDKMGKNPTMNGVAQQFKVSEQTIGQDSSLTFNTQMINGLGIESRVIGAAFDKNNKNKDSKPIEGEGGVYVINTQQINSKGESAEQSNQSKQMRLNQMKQQANGWFEGLRENAKIKDYRSKLM